MNRRQLDRIACFTHRIADDVLRELYVRGKYRDVILPMIVLRRLDAVPEPIGQAVPTMLTSLDQAGIVHHYRTLQQAAGKAPCRTSKFTLREFEYLDQPAVAEG